MPTSPSSLSAGLQTIVNDGLIPSGLTAKQLQNASPGQLTQLEIDQVESSDVSALFGGGGKASDSVNLSGNSSLLSGSTDSNSGSTDPLLQTLESALTASSNSATTNAATGSSTAASSADPTSNTIGTLFSYLG